jgi:hypothetical protein
MSSPIIEIFIQHVFHNLILFRHRIYKLHLYGSTSKPSRPVEDNVEPGCETIALFRDLFVDLKDCKLDYISLEKVAYDWDVCVQCTDRCHWCNQTHSTDTRQVSKVSSGKQTSQTYTVVCIRLFSPYHWTRQWRDLSGGLACI